MTTQDTTRVEIKAGDSLPILADKYLGDVTKWRELAIFNELDIFEELPVGKTITIPTANDVQTFIDNLVTPVEGVAEEITSTVKEILESREGKIVTTLLDVDTQALLKDLDLSSLSSSLNRVIAAPVKSVTDQIESVQNSREWQLISWVLG